MEELNIDDILRQNKRSGIKRTKKDDKPKINIVNQNILDLNQELLQIKQSMSNYKNIEAAYEQMNEREKQKIINRKIGYTKRKIKTIINKIEQNDIKKFNKYLDKSGLKKYQIEKIKNNPNAKQILQKHLSEIDNNINYSSMYGIEKPSINLSDFDNKINKLLGKDVTISIDDSMNKTYTFSLNEMLKKNNPSLYILNNMLRGNNKLQKKLNNMIELSKVEEDIISYEKQLEGLQHFKEVIEYNIGLQKGEDIQVSNPKWRYPITILIVDNEHIRIH